MDMFILALLLIAAALPPVAVAVVLWPAIDMID
jgi:hypothetical protein